MWFPWFGGDTCCGSPSGTNIASTCTANVHLQWAVNGGKAQEEVYEEGKT